MNQRALNYVLAMPPSIAGQGGHDAAFAVACALVQGFALGEEEALAVMREWNALRANPPWSDAQLKHKVSDSLSTAGGRGRGYLLNRDREEAPPVAPGFEGVAPRPLPPPAPRLPAYDVGKLAAFAEGCRREITPTWLREHSPTPLPDEEDRAATQKTFLESVFADGERVLIFTRYFSQGDYLWAVGRGAARLGETPSTVPVASALPTAGREGAWFLSNPVDGAWHIAPGSRDNEPRWSRRSGSAVTAWRHLVLESDTAPTDLWLRALVLLPIPIVAVYTSGGRSVHALVRFDAEGELELNSCRDVLRSTLCPLGADGRALSAVRLTRLPGVLRLGAKDPEGKFVPYPEPRLQRLLYLNPGATGAPIYDSAK